MKNLSIKSVIKKLAWALTALALIFIFYNGIYKLLFFMPNSVRVYDEYGSDVGSEKGLISLVLAIVITISLLYLYDHLNYKIRIYRNAIMLMCSKDRYLMDKLRALDLDNFIHNKDIALSLTLEYQSKLKGFIDYQGVPTPDNEVERAFSSAYQYEIYNEVKAIIKDLNGNYLAYEWLSNIDTYLLKKIPKKLLVKYPEELYYFRHNFLDLVLTNYLLGNRLTPDLINGDDPREVNFLKNFVMDFLSRHKKDNKFALKYDFNSFEQYIKGN